jgi:hypothetical protein
VINGMCSEQTILYTEEFKSNVMKFTKQHDNRESERHYGSIPSEKIRKWRSQEEELQAGRKRLSFIYILLTGLA